MIIKELFEGPVGDYCIARDTIKCLFQMRLSHILLPDMTLVQSHTIVRVFARWSNNDFYLIKDYLHAQIINRKCLVQQFECAPVTPSARVQIQLDELFLYLLLNV